ncbi:MAG: acyltransferase, partial [Candidatus Aquidulcis sp.]
MTLHSAKASAFRPDLEGLRGVAVAAVVLFHSGFSTFSGGFLGVDAFFVLSGFFITSLITREIFETAQFSFARFYARRIRRLLPAVVVVVLVTFVGLTLLISSVVARQEAWSDGIASLLSVANIRFIAVSTDYFAPVVEPSPFLQMWSLSVEEQFYLVWPALLVVAFTLLRRNRLLVALAVGVISLTSLLLFLSGVLGSEATFYSLPTRAWELGLGAYIAIRGTRSNLSQTTALLLAAAAFIIPVFNADLVPGASVLICVAVALIIAGGQRQTWGGRLLVSSPMRFLGKISYSLYLWHWPAIVLLAPKIGMPLAIG